MAKTMNASVKTMTDGQVEDLVAKFRAAVRKHCANFDSEAVQHVLGEEDIGVKLLESFHLRVEGITRKFVYKRAVKDSTRLYDSIEPEGPLEKPISIWRDGSGEFYAYAIPGKRHGDLICKHISVRDEKNDAMLVYVEEPGEKLKERMDRRFRQIHSRREELWVLWWPYKLTLVGERKGHPLARINARSL